MAGRGCPGSRARRGHNPPPHHYVWYAHTSGELVIACAHCPSIYQRTVFAGGPELLERQVQGSRAGHQRICGRPVR